MNEANALAHGAGGDFLIRVVGDSLSMPRASEGISYQHTYAELLRERLQSLGLHRHVSLYNRSRGGAAVTTLLADFSVDSFAFGEHAGDLLIIQSGIVDCAPRPLSRVMRKGVGLLPASPRARAIRFLHDNRAALLRRGLVFRETSPGKFAATYAAWIRAACSAFRWVYAIDIAPTNAQIETRSPGFGASVRQYNTLITAACDAAGKANVRIIGVHDAILQAPDGVNRYINSRDGHHITAAGHRLYCDLIFSHIPQDFGLVAAPR